MGTLCPCLSTASSNITCTTLFSVVSQPYRTGSPSPLLAMDMQRLRNHSNSSQCTIGHYSRANVQDENTRHPHLVDWLSSWWVFLPCVAPDKHTGQSGPALSSLVLVSLCWWGMSYARLEPLLTALPDSCMPCSWAQLTHHCCTCYSCLALCALQLPAHRSYDSGA